MLWICFLCFCPLIFLRQKLDNQSLDLSDDDEELREQLDMHSIIVSCINDEPLLTADQVSHSPHVLVWCLSSEVDVRVVVFGDIFEHFKGYFLQIMLSMNIFWNNKNYSFTINHKNLCNIFLVCFSGDRGDRRDDAGISRPRRRREPLPVRPVHALSGPAGSEAVRLQHERRGTSVIQPSSWNSATFIAVMSVNFTGTVVQTCEKVM